MADAPTEEEDPDAPDVEVIDLADLGGLHEIRVSFDAVTDPPPDADAAPELVAGADAAAAGPLAEGSDVHDLDDLTSQLAQRQSFDDIRTALEAAAHRAALQPPEPEPLPPPPASPRRASSTTPPDGERLVIRTDDRAGVRKR